jgi:multidrug resistance efflux pump
MRLIIKLIVLAGLLFTAGCSSNTYKDRIYGSGIIDADEIDISSKVIGKIIFLAVKEGQDVYPGQVIARLDDYAKAEKDYDRAKNLFADNIIPADQFEQAQKIKDNFIIISPASGTVIMQELQSGEVVTPGAPIITIANTADLWIKSYVSEKDIGRVQLGAEVDVIVDSFPQDVFVGVVTTIASKAEFIPKNIQTKEERLTQVFAVKVAIKNSSGRLKIGMPADVYIKKQD